MTIRKALFFSAAESVIYWLSARTVSCNCSQLSRHFEVFNFSAMYPANMIILKLFCHQKTQLANLHRRIFIASYDLTTQDDLHHSKDNLCLQKSQWRRRTTFSVLIQTTSSVRTLWTLLPWQAKRWSIVQTGCKQQIWLLRWSAWSASYKRS